MFLWISEILTERSEIVHLFVSMPYYGLMRRGTDETRD